MGSADLRNEAQALNDEIVSWRRHIHLRPETGFDTTDTAAFVAERLGAVGATEIETGVGKSGVVAMVRGALPGGTLALRADMDALPITEETGLPFASSREGTMHACGHDAHTAMLLGAAALLVKHREVLRGAVKLIFQPAEELGVGAMAMIKDGVLSGVDAIAGLHTGNLWSGAASGEIGFGRGALMASADLFTIRIQGVGGHGAQPHRAVDPIAIACQIYQAIQTIISREMPPSAPCVLTIATIQAGSAPNIIPETCVMQGTIRAISREQRREMHDRICTVVEGVAAAMRGKAKAVFSYGPPPVICDPDMTDRLIRAAGLIVGPEHVKPVDEATMVGEDMAFYLEKVPGVFFYHPSTFGGGRDHPHHHSKFDVNEDVLWTGAGTLAELALTWQEDEQRRGSD